MSDALVRCSFCNKDQGDVQKVITGPNGVAICNECAAVCQDIVAGKFDRLSASECSATPLNLAQPKGK